MKDIMVKVVVEMKIGVFEDWDDERIKKEVIDVIGDMNSNEIEKFVKNVKYN